MIFRRRMKNKQEMVEDGYKLCRICGEPIIKLEGSRKELNSDEYHWACSLWARTRNIHKEIRRNKRNNKDSEEGIMEHESTGGRHGEEIQ